MSALTVPRHAADPVAGALAAALEYLANGLVPIPVTPDQKQPPLVRWTHYRRHRPTRAQVRRWWERWPEANVAVLTGPLSNLVVLDVDPRNGGLESLAALTTQHGPIGHRRLVDTPNGWHFWLTHPGGVVTSHPIAPGLDVKGDGGLVLAPPSTVGGLAYRECPL